MAQTFLSVPDHDGEKLGCVMVSRSSRIFLVPNRSFGNVAVKAPLYEVVELTFDENGEWFDRTRMTGDLLRVHCRKKRPKCAAVAVRHHGYWFYIEVTDLTSKATLALLLEVYNLEIRGGGGRQVPVLTIGAGGRQR